MNILFLTIGRMESIDSYGIYPDLLRQLRDRGHEIYTVSARERRTGMATELTHGAHVHMLGVRVGNITKCNVLEKGISTLCIGGQFKSAIKRYFGDVKFDLVLYSTPPITLSGVVKWVKRKHKAVSYLLLKDIFPQNAVDLGMLRGLRKPLYWYFRAKERALYRISDRIGCMSGANMRFVTAHNPGVDPARVELLPNCVELRDLRLDAAQRAEMRARYDIPQDKRVFVYGGNLGPVQSIGHLVRCLETQLQNKDAFFLVVGDGTDFPRLQAFMEREKPENMRLLARLPKEDYDRMIAACDVGMIFLDHRFTIPNFPSRLLSYMQAGLPVLACTDVNTDVGEVIVQGGFGWWCESRESADFAACVEQAMNAEGGEGARAFSYLAEHYDAADHAARLLDSVSSIK